LATTSNKTKDYPALFQAIKGLGGAWWHHLDSTWLVKSSMTATEARNVLKQHIDADDELLVIDVTGDARAWAGFNESGSKWLKETFE
jgi:hypothetical protein